MEKELNKVLNWREQEDRPWGDMRADKKGEAMVYVPIPIYVLNHIGRRKGKKKAKGMGIDGRAVVGTATS